MDAKVLMTRNRHLALQLLRGERSVFLIRFGESAELECSLESCSKIDNEFSVANSLSPKKLATMFHGSHYARSTFIDAVLNKTIDEKRCHIMDVKKATMKELVDAYNAKAAKPVKRFSDRATAEKRVLATLNGDAPIEAAASSDEPTTKKTKAKSAAKSAPNPKGEASRKKAIVASWANKKTAKLRSTKNKVVVDGKEYNSVLDAFTQLKLPLNKHIKFRAELKAAGRKTFEGRNFKIVPAGE